MEDVDDDFGELYADVEVEASSAINGVPEVTQMYIQQQKLSNKFGNDSSDVSNSVKTDSGLGDVERSEKDSDRRNDGENEVAMGLESGSDSDDEDDFDVVVNDDDFGAKNEGGHGRECRNVGEDEENEFATEGNSNWKNQDRVDGGAVERRGSGYGGERGHVGKNNYVSQYKFVRQHGSLSMGNQRVINSSRGHKEDVDYIQNRRANLGRVGPSYAGTVPCLSEQGGVFWCPWNRTILDVDIDMFGQKPWTLPGADMTDYFNFDFDEESWKSYCQSLDQLRQQTSTRSHHQVKRMRLNLDNEAAADEEVENRDANEKFFYNGDRMLMSQESKFRMRQFTKQIGRAIHVEDNNIERQPSMDARPPRTRDSDVVIEITVKDQEDSSSGKDEPDKMLETKHSILEDGHAIENVKPETEKTASDKSHNMTKDSVEENIRSPSASTELKRSYDSRTGSSPLLQDYGSHGKRHKSKSDTLHSEKIDAFSRGNSRAVEPLNNSVEDNDRNNTETNPCVAGIDVLFDGQIQSSLTPSDSDTLSKASKDSDHWDLRRAQYSQRSSADSVLDRHRVEKYDYISRKSERCDIKMKGRDTKRPSRVRNAIEDNCKYRHQKVRKRSELSRHNDEDDSYGIRRHIYDRSHSSAHRHRSKARMHASTFREDSPRYREKKSFLGCYDKRIVEHETACRREFHRWDRWSSRDEMDLCSPRGWDEDIFFSESRIQRTKGKIAESEQYLRERECIIRDEEKFFENEPHFTSRYTVDIEQRNLQIDYDDVRSSRRSRHDLSFEYGYSDGPKLDRYAMTYPSNYREAEYFDLEIDYERNLRHIGREVKTSGRGNQYFENPPFDFDYPECIRDIDEDEDWEASRSSKDCLDRHHAYTKKRHDSIIAGDYVDDPRFFEKYGRHVGHISHRNAQDDRRVCRHIDTHDGQDKVGYLDVDDYFVNKRKEFWSNGVSTSRTEDVQFNRHFDNTFQDEVGLDSFESVSRHKWHGTKNEFVSGGMSLQTEVMKQKEGIVRNGGRNSYDSSSKIPTRVEHQKIGMWCRNSVELRNVVVERKTVQPSGKCSKTGRGSDNDAYVTAHERVHKKLQEEKHEVYESGTKNMKDNRGGYVEGLQHDKPHVKNRDDASDLEEGQIPTEEPCKEIPKENKGGMKRMLSNQKATSQKDMNIYDENRILETMAKMEKRRERFKEPILLKKETVPDPKPQVDLFVETSESKQQRPLRKRRWGGN